MAATSRAALRHAANKFLVWREAKRHNFDLSPDELAERCDLAPVTVRKIIHECSFGRKINFDRNYNPASRLAAVDRIMENF
tara:strand:+ start:8456 stop:8698 length:243 start_codon:yes stop_codon:yes gene_type:complete